ncbi:hypothetical protein M438DRAFT_170999 [Aureobasidium pullulans EXF-150]|uniref:Uncharacterized protein n=1 Tax=Aureobasidium pullulans EXF-150 TaxID=1043002 RepID=A0A074WZQ9_AURPU|nr:uncharacterized protein M438DRAFT_170999 [Aureobasidium pullulans EXF-150]KEQ78618.1 hypothetical protein M438DRAFT_170999 [Aureobasidium pullulans EXF-150]
MALSNGAIIVIVIVCCGAFVCCLGAVGWVYRRQDYDQRGVNYGWRPTNNQNDYMREIRSKNQEGMFHAARYHERALSSQPSRSDFTRVRLLALLDFACLCSPFLHLYLIFSPTITSLLLWLKP